MLRPSSRTRSVFCGRTGGRPGFDQRIEKGLCVAPKTIIARVSPRIMIGATGVLHRFSRFATGRDHSNRLVALYTFRYCLRVCDVDGIRLFA